MDEGRALRLRHLRLPLAPVLKTAAATAVYVLLARLGGGPMLLGHPAPFHYAVLGVAAVAFGPLVGLATGLLGELALAAMGRGLWWSVVAAVALVGFWTGLLCRGGVARGFGAGRALRYMAVCLGVHLVAFVVVCPALDMLLYGEAVQNIFFRGAMAALVNTAAAGPLGGVALMVLGALWPRPASPGAG